MTPAAGEEVRQRLSAILFADVVNYSGAMEKDQLGTHRRVKRRVDLFKSLIGDYDGRIFDVEGDAVKAAQLPPAPPGRRRPGRRFFRGCYRPATLLVPLRDRAHRPRRSGIGLLVPVAPG